MNLATPIMICDENEEIRKLLKEMLSKHGYFHLMESHSREELIELLSPEQFLVIHKNLLNEQVIKLISHRRNFLIVAQNDDAETVILAAQLGTNHFVSFPYTSKSLVQKIQSLMN